MTIQLKNTELDEALREDGKTRPQRVSSNPTVDSVESEVRTQRRVSIPLSLGTQGELAYLSGTGSQKLINPTIKFSKVSQSKH